MTNNFFKKFKEIEGQEPEKTEEKEEKIVLTLENKIGLKKVLTKICHGEKICFDLFMRQEEEYIGGDYEKGYTPKYKKIFEAIDRLGHGWHGSSSGDGKTTEHIGPKIFFPEFLIVKHIEDNYDQLMGRVINSQHFSSDDAYLFMALVKNKKDPVTPEEEKYLQRISSSLRRDEHYALTQDLIDEINQFVKEKNLKVPGLEYNDATLSCGGHNEICHINFAYLEIDVKERSELITKLIEQDPIGHTQEQHCCHYNLIHSHSFVEEGGWYAILEGATQHHGRWYNRRREPLVRARVISQLDHKFKLTRELVEPYLDLKNQTHDGDESSIIFAAIINRAYKIESKREPLDLEMSLK